MVVQISHMNFSYQGKQGLVLKDINLSIEQGEYISIIGENGCGKTTLMRLLLGFLKPTSGTIDIVSGRIGYVPQKNEFLNGSFPITVWEVLNSYRRLLKISDKSVIEEALTLVKMNSFRKQLIGNLSGGQVQKIMLARALMGKPELLLLDEPSTGVDVESQDEIYEVIKRMSQERKVTVIAIEHNLEAAFAYSTAIFHLKNGSGHRCNADHYTMEYSYLQNRRKPNATV